MISFTKEQQEHIDSHYMLLPVDADGVPIHVGDSIEYPNGDNDVVRFITFNDNVPTFNEIGWIASKCRHVKPRTLIDVLADFAADVEKGRNDYDMASWYADEIRELLGVSE